jgi:hypothetical protein
MPSSAATQDRAPAACFPGDQCYARPTRLVGAAGASSARKPVASAAPLSPAGRGG